VGYSYRETSLAGLVVLLWKKTRFELASDSLEIAITVK